MTDMALPARPSFSPLDEARVSYGMRAKKLADLAHALLAFDAEAPAGDRIRRALALREQAEMLLNQAVVVEREGGVSWTGIGQAAGGITRQAASERWSPAIAAWKANGSRALTGRNGMTAWDAVASLDHVYASLSQDHPRNAFSSTLDAIRYPDREAARVRQERAAAIDALLVNLHAEADALTRVFGNLVAPSDRSEALRQRARVKAEAARLITELAALDPERGEDHQRSAERFLAESAADDEFAHLLHPAARMPEGEPGYARDSDGAPAVLPHERLEIRPDRPASM